VRVIVCRLLRRREITGKKLNYLGNKEVVNSYPVVIQARICPVLATTICYYPQQSLQRKMPILCPNSKILDLGAELFLLSNLTNWL
jgi:hypothetical protein